MLVLLIGVDIEGCLSTFIRGLADITKTQSQTMWLMVLVLSMTLSINFD